MSTTDGNDWREKMKAKARAFAKERRAELAASPRVQAIKADLKARAKATRKRIADEKKARRQQARAGDRARRDDELAERVAPATPRPE